MFWTPKSRVRIATILPNSCRKKCSSISMGLIHLPDLTDLYRTAIFENRATQGKLNGLPDIPGQNDTITSDQVLGFGIGAVEDLLFFAFYCHATGQQGLAK